MKYKFAISGAANPIHCPKDAFLKAEEVGREVVRQNGILITGATSGIPALVAKGAKDEGGFVVGLSPAASYEHHVKTYRLPTENHDLIIFTGFEYSGRNLLLTRSADAIIIICGGFGTLNEFTIALEDEKPIGILSGSGGTAEHISNLLREVRDPHNHGSGKVVFSSNPKELVSNLINLIEREYKKIKSNPPR